MQEDVTFELNFHVFKIIPITERKTNNFLILGSLRGFGGKMGVLDFFPE